MEKGHEYPLKKRLRLSMFFKAKQAAQPFVKKEALDTCHSNGKNRRAWMGGLQVLVVQKDPKNDENIHKKMLIFNIDFCPQKPMKKY